MGRGRLAVEASNFCHTLFTNLKIGECDGHVFVYTTAASAICRFTHGKADALTLEVSGLETQLTADQLVCFISELEICIQQRIEQDTKIVRKLLNKHGATWYAGLTLRR